MEIITNPEQPEIKKAAKALKDGHLVAFPTETVYGLGADATNEKAVSRVYSVKGRPSDHPLIVHISSIKQLNKWAIEIPNYAMKLAKEFWPGPLTLILKRNNLARDFITGGQDNVGIRVPAQTTALELLKEFEALGGNGIVAPSANRFGKVSPTCAKHVYDDLGNYLTQNDVIIDGGSCLIGIESTIVNCTGKIAEILRPGLITSEMIEAALGNSKLNIPLVTKIKFSGAQASHYKPNALVVLNDLAKPGDGFIALEEVATPIGAVRLASPRNVHEFANQMYSALRIADEKNISKITVITPSGSGIALAINDRLKKASTI